MVEVLSYEITLGDTLDVTVYCEAFGDPQPTISFDGDTMAAASAAIYIAEYDRYTTFSILTVIDVTEDFNVICTATNVWGDASQEITIETEGLSTIIMNGLLIMVTLKIYYSFPDIFGPP